MRLTSGLLSQRSSLAASPWGWGWEWGLVEVTRAYNQAQTTAATLTKDGMVSALYIVR